MGTLLPKKLCTNRRRAVEELIKGRDAAAQLQILVEKPTGLRGPVVVSAHEELVVKILRSFSEAVPLLMSSCDAGCEACRISATDHVGSPSSGESSKRPAAKDRRGCYKRRKASNSWMKVSSTVEDGLAWRKYGQKEILNAKFPRCYFRCTHKPDQGCLATKQVQRIQESPNPMYQTTYFGHHTCKSYPLKPSLLLLHSLDLVESAHSLLSFESKIPSDHQEQHPSIKEECKEETQSNLSGPGDLPALEPIVWPELMELESSASVYSSASTSSHALDEIDFLIESVDFENDFPFEETN